MAALCAPEQELSAVGRIGPGAAPAPGSGYGSGWRQPRVGAGSWGSAFLEAGCGILQVHSLAERVLQQLGGPYARNIRRNTRACTSRMATSALVLGPHVVCACALMMRVHPHAGMPARLA